jgi:hypothetical protein
VKGGPCVKAGGTGLRIASLAVVAAAGLLSACSYMSDSLWPTITGDAPPPSSRERVSIPPSRAEANAQPTLSPGAPPAPVTAAPVGAPAAAPQATGTHVGQKVAQLFGELQRLQAQVQQQNQSLQQLRAQTTQNAQRYHGTVAAVQARLQLGTTPGNPILVSQWNAAQADLDRLASDIGALNGLASQVAGSSALAAYVLESARAAYNLQGAVDEDHRQLAILEDQTNRTVVLVDRLLTEINEDAARQTAYVSNERANLTTLSLAIKNGELYGPSLLSRAFAPAGSERPAFSTSATPSSGFAVGGRRPLVVIRFDRPDVAYQQQLYQAISKALEQRPDAQFDLVAVAPGVGGAAEGALGQSQSRRYANQVMRSMTEMGLPASRVSLAATTSPGSATNEVHVYVR